MSNKRSFGMLEKLAPIYVLNGAHVVLALDAQRLVEQLQYELRQSKDVIKNYEFLLQNSLPVGGKEHLKLVK